MNDWEKASIVVLLAMGTLLTVGTLVWFGIDHKGGGGFVSNAVTTTGTGAEKSVTETNYSDTVVSFGLTVGSALLLAGALYGRLRDITLGNLKMVFDDGQPPADDSTKSPSPSH